MAKRRLKQGEDWHGWVLQDKDGDFYLSTVSYKKQETAELGSALRHDGDSIVKVKLTEVT